MQTEETQNNFKAVQAKPLEELIDPVYYEVFGKNVSDEEFLRYGEEGYKELLLAMG